MIQRGNRTHFLIEALVKRSAEILMATSRPMRESRARNTSPIPPAPIGATIFIGAELLSGC
jgi:hypothetical protein